MGAFKPFKALKALACMEERNCRIFTGGFHTKTSNLTLFVFCIKDLYKWNLKGPERARMSQREPDSEPERARVSQREPD